MTVRSYLSHISPRSTPQAAPIPGREADQVANSAGGFVFRVTDWDRLDRFLVLGTSGGSYYASERALTVDNARAVAACIAADGSRAVARIVELSEQGRAPRNDPAILALALCAKRGDAATRKAAFDALPRVCRTGTHLFAFARAIDELGGWGRGARTAVARWYGEKAPRDPAYQLTKYRERDGWGHRDLLRLSHPTPRTAIGGTLYRYAARAEWERPAYGPDDEQAEAGRAAVRYIEAVRELGLAAPAPSPAAAARLIRDNRLPREVVPTGLLSSPAVWDALLADMPMAAMIRNLATMTRLGLIAPLSEATRTVCERLGDAERLARARIHPVALLMALRTYAGGRGMRGRHTWTPVPQVADALDGAFYAAFKAVEPTDRRLVLGLDVSGSMGMGSVAGVRGFTPREAAAAMALVTAATERQCAIMAFSDTFTPLGISPRQRLDEAVRLTSGLPFRATDCALPMLWAMEHGVQADAFVIYTDSETYHGGIHPVQALRTYRQKTGIAARLVVVGMVSNEFSIADPDDAGMMDVVGMDAAAPTVIADFIRAWPLEAAGCRHLGTPPSCPQPPVVHRGVVLEGHDPALLVGLERGAQPAQQGVVPRLPRRGRVGRGQQAAAQPLEVEHLPMLEGRALVAPGPEEAPQRVRVGHVLVPHRGVVRPVRQQQPLVGGEERGAVDAPLVPHEGDPARGPEDARELAPSEAGVEPVERLPCHDEVHACVREGGPLGRARDAREAREVSQQLLARRAHRPVGLDPEDTVAVAQEQAREVARP